MVALSQGDQTPKGQRCDLIHTRIIASALQSVCMCAQETEQGRRINRRGGSGVGSLIPKHFLASNQKQKKDKNGSDNRDPLITAWGCGESDRGAGMDAAGGLPCCRPKSLPNTMCLCQPTTNSRKKKKKSHHQIVDSQLPWPKNNNSPPILDHSKTHMHNTLPRSLPSIWPEHHGHHRW